MPTGELAMHYALKHPILFHNTQSTQYPAPQHPVSPYPTPKHYATHSNSPIPFPTYPILPERSLGTKLLGFGCETT